jgi:DNA primase small subunit
MDGLLDMFGEEQPTTMKKKAVTLTTFYKEVDRPKRVRPVIEEETMMEAPETVKKTKVTFIEDEEERSRSIYLDYQDSRLDTSLYYIQQRYPVDILVKLMTMGGKYPLSHCEIVFVVKSCWWRKRIFPTQRSLQSFITHQSPPERIEIGPIHQDADRKTLHRHKTLRRHLVFDLDIEDDVYYRVCGCVGKKLVCSDCWVYARVGMLCLMYILKNEYGYKYIMPVYSGRRGVHVWVLDHEAASLLSTDREAIMDRIDVAEAHQSVYEPILKPAFNVFVENQNQTPLDHANIAQVVDGVLPSFNIEMMAVWSQSDVGHVKKIEQTRKLLDDAAYKKFMRSMAYRLLWPRLDRPVTVAMNHCTKAPFVIHPETKRVSVPIPPRRLNTWVPNEAPRISQVIVTENGQYYDCNVLESYLQYARAILTAAYPLQVAEL